MAVSYGAQSNSGWTISTTTAVTKPSGLAVGDLMISFSATNGGSFSHPTGFTSIGFTSPTGGAFATYLGYKYADSGDVAASSFTFNIAGGSTLNFCSIVSVISPNTATSLNVSASGTASNTSTPSISAAVTPARADSLLLQFWHGANSVGSIATYAIATSNPSWSESYDSTNGGGNCASMAYANRPQVTSTGNISAAGGTASSDWGAWLISISPSQSLSISDTVTLTDNYFGNLSVLSQDTVTLTDNFDNDKQRVWSRDSKPSTTWNYPVK